MVESKHGMMDCNRSSKGIPKENRPNVSRIVSMLWHRSSVGGGMRYVNCSPSSGGRKLQEAFEA